MDIIIMLVAFSAQCANTYVGWSVTKNPIGPDDRRRALVCEVIVWISFVIGAVAIVVLGVRGRSAQNQLDRIEQGIEKPRGLKLRAFEAVQGLWLVHLPRENEAITVSVSHINAAMATARNVVSVSRSYLYSGDQYSITPEIEDKYFDRFESETKDIDRTHGYDAASTEPDFITTTQPTPLTAQEASDILGGRQIIFEVGHILFSDDYGRHTNEFCRWLQYPIGRGIWHICRDHNGLAGEKP